MEILQQYEIASGQQINQDKTQLFFSSNSDPLMQENIMNLLGVLATSHYEKYLGLPSFVGKAKNKVSAIFESVFGIKFKVGKKNC